ncbi:MAG: hypothetical protein V1912_09390 [bacterium]
MIALPTDCREAGDRPDEQRLDQLTQALCGCWVARLSERGLARLLEAIVGEEETGGGHKGRTAAGGC